MYTGGRIFYKIYVSGNGDGNLKNLIVILRCYRRGEFIMRNDIRKDAYEKIRKLNSNRSSVKFIHYSCGSFTDISEGYSPRINSIAILDWESGQTTAFSIHRVAERKKISIEDIESSYDSLEKEMLDEYFDYLKDAKNVKWVHWNMRDPNYGFQAIEHRYQILGGKPCCVPDTNKFDLARLLDDLYGAHYVEHPKMKKIMQLNAITDKDFMSGKDEAAAFKNKDFSKVYLSTLRKVQVFSKILELTAYKSLKTKSSIKEQYGLSLQGLYEYCTSNVLIMLLWQIISLILGGWIGSWFN